MRIAFISDIHSNHVALEACMRRIEEDYIDGIAFLGDYVTDCPYPQKTLRILTHIPEWYKTWFIRGNREDYLLDHRYNTAEQWSFCSQSGSLLYTFEELRGSDLRFFEVMPIGMEIKPEGFPPVSICHGSMQDNRLLFDWQCPIIDEVLEESNTALTICGHMHTPYTYRNGGKTIVNVGSCGLPEHGSPQATMLIAESDGGEWKFEHIFLPFDTERVIAEFDHSGLAKKAPVWSRCAIATLRTGTNCIVPCVERVRTLALETGLPFSEEKLWLQAADELGV